MTLSEEFKHLKIGLEDIKAATYNFAENKVIRTGGSGKVYEGELCHFKGRSRVAIKRFDLNFAQRYPDLWKEIMMLSRYRHKNLISLLGVCDEGDEHILVYEHAFNGSLDHHLSSTSLTWTQRIMICLNAAKGIKYLHDHNVLHRDIKSSNILLDENSNAKVSDIGLSQIVPLGSFGYCDPQYLKTYSLTKESDIYSFGVVLFEVICGRLCFKKTNDRHRVELFVSTWRKSYKHKKLESIIFKDLEKKVHPRALEAFSDIAFQCSKKSPEKRPTISHVLEKLKSAHVFQEPYDLRSEFKQIMHLSCEVFHNAGQMPKGCGRAMDTGVVKATCEEIFELVMSMDGRRFEWDCSFDSGALVEEVDAHTTILYHRLHLDWFPMLVWPRDLCYVRYWRRNDDGSYVILFQSKEHEKYSPQPGYVRAHIESGGFKISPLKPRNGRPITKVQYDLQIDLKGWGVGYVSLFKQHCLQQMLKSVAGLQAYFDRIDERAGC